MQGVAYPKCPWRHAGWWAKPRCWARPGRLQRCLTATSWRWWHSNLATKWWNEMIWASKCRKCSTPWHKNGGILTFIHEGFRQTSSKNHHRREIAMILESEGPSMSPHGLLLFATVCVDLGVPADENRLIYFCTKNWPGWAFYVRARSIFERSYVWEVHPWLAFSTR